MVSGASAGTTFELTEGTFVVNGMVTLTQGDITIKGAGKDKTVVSIAGNGYVFSIGGIANTTISDLRCTGITVANNASNLTVTNCAIIGAVLINMNEGLNFIESVVHATGAGLGFLLAIVIFAGLRERIERSNVPPAFRGLPITLIAAGLMSIAFLGFAGLI